MKHTLYIILLLSLGFQGCKKGEDDPFISLRSRKARLKGSWLLVTGFENYSSTTTFSGSSFTFSSGATIENGTMTVNSFYDNSESSESYDYTQQLNILRDGSFTLTTVKDGDTTEEKDMWFFVDGNKKRIGVQLGDETYHIKELRNKKLVLTYSKSQRTDYELGGYAESSTDGELLFEHK